MSGATKAVRREVLLRDQLQCVACGLTVAVEDANDVRPVQQYSLQHRIARGMGGRSVIDEPVNLLVMCGTGTTGCHGKAEGDPSWARERGYRVESYESPETVPVVVRVAPGVDEVIGLDGAARVRLYAIGPGNTREHRPMNPDCRDGKHRPCAGDAWDDAADESTFCHCDCHGDTTS